MVSLLVEAIGTLDEIDYEAFSREGRAKGRAEGRAQSIVTVLEARDVEVPEDIRKRILACRSLRQLNQWLKRAVTATSAGEVVAA
jgi:hypothetical protein